MSTTTKQAITDLARCFLDPDGQFPLTEDPGLVGHEEAQDNYDFNERIVRECERIEPLIDAFLTEQRAQDAKEIARLRTALTEIGVDVMEAVGENEIAAPKVLRTISARVRQALAQPPIDGGVKP